MAGTAVEQLPGGLLAALAGTRHAGAGATALDVAKRHCLAGAWQAATAALTGTGRDGDALEMAWRRLATQGALRGLPDGDAWWGDTAGPGSAWLPRPADGTGLPEPAAAECRMLEVVVSLRDYRAMSVSLNLTPPAAVTGLGLAEVAGARPLVEAGRPDLLGHLTLLDADLRSRSGRSAEAEARWREACAEFTDRSDDAGLACAALVAGDWLAAPFTSPVSWNTALVAMPSSKGSELTDEFEQLEFGGPDANGAQRAYHDAQERFERLGDRWGQAVVRWRLAYLRLRRGDPDGAATEFELSSRDLAEAGDAQSSVLARLQAALAALAADRLPADPAAAQAILAWATGPGGRGTGAGMALLPARMGRRWLAIHPERAAAAFRIAEDVWRGLNNPLWLWQSLADRAAVARALGDRSTARIEIARALETDDLPLSLPADPLDPRRTRRIMLAADLYVLANDTSDLAAMDHAIRQLTNAVAPLRARRREFDGNRRYAAEQLIEYADHFGDGVMGLLYRAYAARDSGDEAKASQWLEQAERVLAAAPEQELPLALLAAYRLDFTTAARAYERHLRHTLAKLDDDRSGIPAWLRRREHRAALGQAFVFFIQVHDTNAAEVQLAELRNSGEPWWHGLGAAWEYLYALGQLEELKELEKRKEREDGPGRDDFVEAARTYTEAIAEVAKVREGLRTDQSKSAFAGERMAQRLYRAAARVALRRRDAAIGLGDPEAVAAHAGEAVRYAEEARARALLDLLAANAATTANAGTQETVLAWRAATAQVQLCRDRLRAELDGDNPEQRRREALDHALRDAETKVVEVEESMRRQAPSFWASAAPETRTTRLTEIAEHLPPKTAVLQYSADSPDLLRWALTRDGMVAAKWSESQRSLSRLTGAVIDLCANEGPIDQLQDHAGELARILLDPLAQAIDQAEHLIIVGSGPTLRLPFQVLPWQGRPLGLQKSLSAVPSLSMLRFLDAAPDAPPGRALVVGDPAGMAYQSAPQSPLPWAAHEAAYVKALLPDADLLLGPDATGRRVRELLPSASTAHLASHGCLDDQAPLASSVLLANGDSLTVAELIGLRMPADLVVLSFCHSGAGTVVGGDELLGFGRGLLAAGARSIVLGRWQTTVSAALFMREMYRQLRNKASTAEALLRAAIWLHDLDAGTAMAALLELRQLQKDSGAPAEAVDVSPRSQRGGTRMSSDERMKFAHPYHWAPYVLVGRPSAKVPALWAQPHPLPRR